MAPQRSPENSPTRVLVLMPLAERLGGCEARLLDLMRHPGNGGADGIDWTVVFLEDGPMVEEVRAAGVDARVALAGRLRQGHRQVRAALRVAALAREKRATVILSWMAKAHFVGTLAGRLAHVPAVWYRRELASDRGWLARIVTLLPARAVLTNSRAVEEAQARLWPRRRTMVVYPGIDLRGFDPLRLPRPDAARRSLGLTEAGPLIGMVGRLQRSKGADVLVDAMVRIRARYPDARCVLVGGRHVLEPDLEDFLRARCEGLGLDKWVIMAGHQGDVATWMQAMDVVVLTSYPEAFGAVVVEGMALGKPVVASCVGGPAEIITHEVDGLLVPYGDSEALAAAVLRYLDDASLRQRVAHAAQTRAKVFSIERVSQALGDALRKVSTGTNP